MLHPYTPVVTNLCRVRVARYETLSRSSRRPGHPRLATFIVRDTPISQILAQACGHADGLTRGWDGSLHTRSSFTLRCLKRTFSVRYGSLLARR